VGFDSTSRNSNLPIADFICNYMDRPAVRIERNPSSDGNKTNLVISLGPEADEDRNGLVLSGHMDVVPADEPEWQSDPFRLTRSGNEYVARGACDMKGFLALAMNAALESTSADLAKSLMLIFTYDEEVGTIGAERLVKTWSDPAVLPRNAIIGEPTGLRVIRMHKGHLEFRITVTGTSAHSGYPHLGRNAIEPVGKLIAGLSYLREQLENENPPYGEYFPEVPYAALNVGRVTGGSAINIVPDRCVLECGIRLLPEMDKHSIIQRVTGVVSVALADSTYEIDLGGEAPPMLLDDQSPIYQALCSEVGQTQTLSVSYATDAGWLQSLGLDCAIFGPGSIEVAHKPNESIPIEQLERGGHILERVVYQFCMMH
jgi:acetylornithine deacetylase